MRIRVVEFEPGKYRLESEETSGQLGGWSVLTPTAVPLSKEGALQAAKVEEQRILEQLKLEQWQQKHPEGIVIYVSDEITLEQREARSRV